MGKVNKKELESACQILGINFNDFVESPEIEKGLEDDKDYKPLYEHQRDLNLEIIKGIGNIPNFIEKSISDEIKNIKIVDNSSVLSEIQKSLNSIGEEINEMKEIPMRKAKSFKSVSAVEKSLNQNTNGAKETYQLSNPIQAKKLKNFLAQKTFEYLEKGIENSIYEKATMQLDASKKVSNEIRSKLLKEDDISIID